MVFLAQPISFGQSVFQLTPSSLAFPELLHMNQRESRQAPRVCAWNRVAACFKQGQVEGTNQGSERGEGQGEARNNPIFASLTKENEGLEPGWLELAVEKPLL